MLIFTSGTTGAPKAVRISHGKLAAWGSHLAARFPLVPDDICYSVMPLFHSNAQVAGYTAPLSAGSTTVLRQGGKLRWPFSLQEEKFTKERQKLDELFPQALKLCASCT